MTPFHQVQRIHAGNNGVYDAVFSEDAGEWFIRFVPYAGVAMDTLVSMKNRTCLPPGYDFTEYSTTGYDSAHAARLAWEREQVTYQTLAQIRLIA